LGRERQLELEEEKKLKEGAALRSKVREGFKNGGRGGGHDSKMKNGDGDAGGTSNSGLNTA